MVFLTKTNQLSNIKIVIAVKKSNVDGKSTN